jgi:WD40 repeat protein
MEFFKKHIKILVFFLCTGIAFGQEPIEKVGKEGLLYVLGEDILPITSTALTSDGDIIAIRLNRKIWLYSLMELKPIKSVAFVGGERLGGEITFSPDNKLIACGDAEGIFWVWSTATGKLIESKRGFSEEGSGMEYIHSISFSNNGNYLAVGNAGTEVFLWDANSWKQIRLFKHHGDAMSVRFSSDNKYLGVATANISKAGYMKGKIAIWDWKANRNISEIITEGVLAAAIAFSPDGQVIAGGNTDGDIGIWRITDGSLVTKLKGHNDRIFDLSFSSNGEFLASASEDQDTIIWDMQQLKLLKKLPHNNRVLTVTFWQNDNALVTTDKRGINFWRISDGKQLGRFLVLEGEKFVIFTSEGYFETDAPDSLRPIRQENRQDSIKKILHQPNMVSKILHISFNKKGDRK